jgi:hypothetical protein
LEVFGTFDFVFLGGIDEVDMSHDHEGNREGQKEGNV